MRLTFDRGTLVFEDAPAAALLEDLPGCVWDARVGRRRSHAYMHAEVLDALAERGVPRAAHLLERHREARVLVFTRRDPLWPSSRTRTVPAHVF